VWWESRYRAVFPAVIVVTVRGCIMDEKKGRRMSGVPDLFQQV